MEYVYELVVSIVIDPRVKPRLADVLDFRIAPTIDDVRRIAMRLRTLRSAWRAVALRTSLGGQAAPFDVDRARRDGSLLRFDMRVLSREPLIDADAIDASDARAKLEALSSAVAGDVVTLETWLYPTSAVSDPLLFPVPSWPVHWPRAGEAGVLG